MSVPNARKGAAGGCVMTRKEACVATGYGLTWLKSHKCGWCDQGALAALMYGCASIYGPRCDVAARFRKDKEAVMPGPEDAP
jgi:hypothetical protein